MVITEKDEFILKIGSKGEIFPPKEVREKLGLISNQSIILTVFQDKLIVRKLYSIDEILQKPIKVKISYQAWKQFRKNLSEEAEY
ncbi:MAG TPA: AbrB/MazE/SpoVT family DNA-binding domain-containing protein [Candidatus Deferrimicrobium sp.]|nr:AbrB/MazE/SpoVT family DNA-binding domain-containing protein [Candidatus Deferrimicrobium sp.]